MHFCLEVEWIRVGSISKLQSRRSYFHIIKPQLLESKQCGKVNKLTVRSDGMPDNYFWNRCSNCLKKFLRFIHQAKGHKLVLLLKEDKVKNKKHTWSHYVMCLMSTVSVKRKLKSSNSIWSEKILNTFILKDIVNIFMYDHCSWIFILSSNWHCYRWPGDLSLFAS